MNVEIANRLMQYRKKAGLSQEELADKLGVSRQAVSKWECAESSPDTDNLIALSKIYNVSLDELINGNETPHINKEDKKKKGIHISNEDGEVHIEGVNIHLKDNIGSEVHVDTDGVEIIDNEGHIKSSNHIDIKDDVKKSLLETIIGSSIALICTIAYILIGTFIKDGWKNYWVIFFLIPIVPSLLLAIRKRKATLFAYPLFATALYLTLGMFLNLWHPTWVLFISIPVYYSIFGPIDRYQKERHHIVIDNKED